MRLFGLLAATAMVAGLIPTPGLGQGGESRRAEEQIEPYHKHRDTRHGHDHYYPDRGSIVRDLPKGTIGLNYAGISYRYHDGIWFEPRGPAFMIVAPPIGLVVPSLPPFATALAARGGETYLYVNSTYYKPRPDLGGYEVVNDPPESVAALGSEMLVAPPANAGPTVAEISGTGTAATTATPTTAASPAPTTAASLAPTTAASLVTPSIAAAQTPAGSPPPSASALPQSSAAALPVAPVNTTSIASVPTAPISMASANGVAPAAGVATAATPVSFAPSSQQSPSPAAKGPKVFLYPKSGQTADQQARDRYDCYRFAVAQSGFDPMRGGAASNSEPQTDFERAQAACFDARGYASR